MKRASAAVQALVDRIEPALAYARIQEDPAETVAACKAFLQLYAEPPCTLYGPAEFLKANESVLADDTHQLHVEPFSNEYVGAPGLVLTCLRTLVQGVALEDDSVLDIEVFEEEERRHVIPRVALSLDGPGSIPDEFVFEGFFRLSLEELGERWTLVSQGGRLDKTPNGLLLRLTGMRMPPEPLAEAEELLAILGRTTDAAAIDEALAYIDGPLPVLDGATDRMPADLGAVLREVLEEREDDLNRRSIRIETMLDPKLPPIALRRGRMRAFFATLLDCAAWILPPNSAVVVMIEYEAEARDAGILATLTAKTGPLHETFHTASLERAIKDHQGRFTCSAGHCPSSAGGHEAVITATLPDTVGKTLDAWLPGWERFSERSQRMLRLLKSGGHTPPEDFILGGVLEEELERWLFPLLSSPLARNIAHKMKPERSGVPGADHGRLRKALEQVARGKPKKELCRPPYAGELFWAFRGDYRQRSALGTQLLDDAALRAFCESLLATPPRALACLRILAEGL